MAWQEEQERRVEKAARVFIAFDVRFARFSLRKRKKSAKWSGRMSKNLEYLLHSSSVCVSRSESLVGYLGYEPCVLGWGRARSNAGAHKDSRYFEEDEGRSTSTVDERGGR